KLRSQKNRGYASELAVSSRSPDRRVCGVERTIPLATFGSRTQPRRLQITCGATGRLRLNSRRNRLLDFCGPQRINCHTERDMAEIAPRNRMARSPGYSMPAEWAPHRATWLSWPHNLETWPSQLEKVRKIWLEMIRTLSPHEQ